MSRLAGLLTSKRKVPTLLGIVSALAVIAIALNSDLTNAARPVLAAVLGIAAIGCILVLVLRARSRRTDAEFIERSFETSILAFPPEPRLGRRDLSRR
jgi:hypothetical protein